MPENFLLYLYIFGRFLVFFVFLGCCLSSSVMFRRNVWCMFFATPLGSGLAIVIPFLIPLTSNPQMAEVSEHIIKEQELWQYVCLYVLFEMYIALGIGLVFALLRFVFRIRGFGRDFWYPVGMMSGVYPLALYMCLVVLAFSPMHQY